MQALKKIMVANELSPIMDIPDGNLKKASLQPPYGGSWFKQRFF
jgi:hypothetical protein